MTHYLEALVPSDPGDWDLIARINKARLKDGSRAVELGSLDDATLNLVFEVVYDNGKNLHLQIPAGRQDLALALGLYLQLERRGTKLLNREDPNDFSGPIVAVGLNLNITERLRRIRIGVANLGDSIVARRVRGDGRVVDLSNFISQAHVWNHGLLYLNASLGWPPLPKVQPELTIIDGTTLRNPDSLERALAWALSHRSRRIILISELGMESPRTLAEDPSWLSFPWTPALLRDVKSELGSCPEGGLLSTNALVCAPPQPIGAALYQAPALALARRQALTEVAAARRLPGPMPESVRNCVRLINALAYLWGNLATADRHAISQGRTFSITSTTRRIEADRGVDLHGGWAAFRETRWACLRRASLEFSRLLDESNPRLNLLAQLLTWAAANRAGVPVCIRTVSRSATSALIEDLAEVGIEAANDDASGSNPPLSVRPYTDRLPWTGSPALEFHLGAPPPWRRSALLSGSASEHIVALDKDEVPWLKTSLAFLSDAWSEDFKSVGSALQIDFPSDAAALTPRKVFGPLPIDARGEVEANAELVELPTLDLTGLFAAFVEVLPEAVDDPEEVSVARPCVSARVLRLAPSSTYYLPEDAEVEVLVGEDYKVMPLSDLSVGMTILISRGEGRGGLFSRLKLASHNDVDVRAANLLLARFRQAVLNLHAQERTWDNVAKALRKFGSTVESGATCRSWATGDSIAPEDIDDIRRVAWAVKDDRLTDNSTWQRLGAIAKELRRMHRGLGRTVSAAISEAAAGKPGPNCELIRQACGSDPMEVLEEFQVARVIAIGEPELVERHLLRQVRPAQSA